MISTVKSSMKYGNKLFLIFFSAFLLTIHYASVVYINSSLLKQIISDQSVSVLFIIGSVCSIVVLSLAPFFFKKIGSKYTFLIFIAIECFAVFGIGSTSVALFILALFVIHQAAESLLYFCLDVALEEETKIEGTTGGKRGIFFTVQNIAWVFAPLVLLFLVSKNNFSHVYFLSGAALLPVFLLVALFFRNSRFTETPRSHLFHIFKSLRHGGDTTRIVITQFILNFFYAWMVIYLPLLLNKEIGFGWDKIGIILSIMLVPFLLIELPAGFLADKRYGEREMLALGFIVMGLSTFAIPLINEPNFWLWAFVLFITRVGASLVEISSETYFFKHVKPEDTGVISIFRMSRPFSLILAPIVAIPLVTYFTYSASFTFLAILALLGLTALPKKDTR